jgi:multiple sugar transport system ATP-binding protein
MATIEFRDIEKVFDDGTRAVSDFSLRIEEGEFMAFVGPSGCGKSTLLRMLAGLETPTSGDILIGNQRVNPWTPQQRNVAMVFQNYALYPHMTVYQNLEFPLRMAKMPKRERSTRVRETADLLGLTDFLARTPKQLSGGQRQRVAMGRAVIRQPSVFLMDEPLSNLDAKLRVQIRSEIAALQQRLGTTTIYVTHDQIEAMTLGNRVTLLRDGVLQQVASPQDLYSRPDNIFVAGFLGNPGMNLFPVRLTRGANGMPIFHVGAQKLEPNLTEMEFSEIAQGEPLLAGLRPEALFASHENERSCGLRVKVDTVESLGHEQLVYARLPTVTTENNEAITRLLRSVEHDPDQIIMRLSTDRTVQAGSDFGIGIDCHRLYLFDLEGKALYFPKLAR